MGGGWYDDNDNIIAMIASSFSVKERLKTSFKLSTVSQLGKREREKKQDVETNIWKTASLNYLENCTILKLRHETGKEKYSTGNNPDSSRKWLVSCWNLQIFWFFFSFLVQQKNTQSKEVWICKIDTSSILRVYL